jgi:aspartate/methionine/tyrosine aminotransferase
MNSNRKVDLLSRRVTSIPQASSVQINQQVSDMMGKGEDVINLSLGEAFFTIPKIDFNDIDLTKGYHYSSSMGLPCLRKKIQSYYKKSYDSDADWSSEILITAGSKIAIFMCMLAVLDEGEEVLIHEPAWLSYKEQARLAGGMATSIPYNVTSASFDEHITKNTKMLIINNPNNPQGKLYSAEELQEIYALCKKLGVYLLVDEAYSDFVVVGKFVSALSAIEGRDNLVVVNSLSKNFGMSGWRIGYVISNSRFIEEILKLNQHLVTCAPTLLQMYLTKHFDYILAETLPQAQSITRKRNKVKELVDKLGLRVLPGGATFYLFLDVSDWPMGTESFVTKLLEDNKISVVPGISYGKSTVDFVRISLGTESFERIEFALKRIRELLYVEARG